MAGKASVRLVIAMAGTSLAISSPQSKTCLLTCSLPLGRGYATARWQWWGVPCEDEGTVAAVPAAPAACNLSPPLTVRVGVASLLSPWRSRLRHCQAAVVRVANPCEDEGSDNTSISSTTRRVWVGVSAVFALWTWWRHADEHKARLLPPLQVEDLQLSP